MGVHNMQMMRGFQIWLQYSNQITFDPHFGQTTVESRDFSKIPIKPLDLSFLVQKEVKCYPI